MPHGYSLPLSPQGTASLVPAPPWHYVGDFLVIEYWADPAAVAAVLPEGLEPFGDDPGRAAALFVDWQSCSDSGAELLELGLVLGLILCAGALRALHSVLYGVVVYDIPTILVVALTLSAVSILATTVPTLRIARIDPAKTLREE